MKLNYFNVLILTLLNFLVTVNGEIQLYIKDSNQNDVYIYKDKQVPQIFSYTDEGETMCNPNPTVTEQQETLSKEFYIQNLDTENPVKVKILLQNFDSVIIHPVFDLSYRENTYLLEAGQTIAYNLTYNCNFAQNLGQFSEAWSRLEFIVNYQTIIENTSQKEEKFEFSMLKICNLSKSRFDGSIVVLLVVASIIVCYGSKLREHLPLMVNENHQEQEVNEQLTAAHAIGFILIGSTFLVLLYFFMAYLKYVLMLCIMISSFSSSSVIIYDALFYFFERIQTCVIPRLNICKTTFNFLNIISIFVSLSLVISYFYTRNFMLSNIIALFLVLLMLKIIVIPNLKVATLFLTLAFFYDIFWVFISPYFFNGNSVMASVATNVHLPMMFQCPYFKPYPEPRCSMIGLGDLVLPGVFVSFCYSFQIKMNTKSYHAVCCAGYCFGLFICMFNLAVMGMAQPALLYLTPCTLIPVSIVAYNRGELKQIWTGYYDDDHDDLINEDEEDPSNQVEMISQ